MDTIIESRSASMSNKLCNFVKYVNGEVDVMEGCKRSLSRYRKIILNMGYHYIYADKEILPVPLIELFAEQLNTYRAA